MGLISKPSLLMLTAAAAGMSAVGNAVGLAAAPEPSDSRLGVQIRDDMATRDRAAARRDRAIALREQAARAAEARLAGPAKPAAATDSGPAGPAPAVTPAGGGGAPVADQYDDLAKIYQAMKPAAAAAVLEQLDVDVQMRVAQKMRERSTAMILAAMTPRGAATLTMALARRQAGPIKPLAKPARR